jgi:hypothetical protein
MWLCITFVPKIVQYAEIYIFFSIITKQLLKFMTPKYFKRDLIMKPEVSFDTLLLEESVYSESSPRFYETKQHYVPQDVILPET